MRIRAASWLVWSLCAAAFSLLALALLLIVPGWSTPLPRGWISWQGQAISVVGLIGAPVLGGLVASRRPENPYGWLWLGLSLGLALLLFGQVYAAYSMVVEPGSLPSPGRSVTWWRERGGWRRSQWCLCSCCCSSRAGCRRAGGGLWRGPWRCAEQRGSFSTRSYHKKTPSCRWRTRWASGAPLGKRSSYPHPNRPGAATATRGCGLHPCDRGPVQSLEAPYPVVYRSPLLSQEVRCDKDPGSLLWQAEKPSSTQMASGHWQTGWPTTHRPPCLGQPLLRGTSTWQDIGWAIGERGAA